MDRGAWWAAVHGVAKSQTQLSDFTFHFHALEKEMANHSSVLAWRIPGTGEPGGLLSMGSHRVGHDWSDLAAADCSLPGTSVHGIFQERILEQAATSSSREPSPPRDWTQCLLHLLRWQADSLPLRHPGSPWLIQYKRYVNSSKFNVDYM